jgi:hypothetical protein
MLTEAVNFVQLIEAWMTMGNRAVRTQTVTDNNDFQIPLYRANSLCFFYI